MPKNIYFSAKSKTVWARIRRADCIYHQWFSLAKYKTRKKAETEALKWIEKMRATLPPRTPRKISPLNTSGVLGVRLGQSTKVQNGNTYYNARWIAFWGSCAYKVGWSVYRYGDKGAFIRAYLSRQKRCKDKVKIEKAYNRLTLDQLKAMGKLKKRRL